MQEATLLDQGNTITETCNKRCSMPIPDGFRPEGVNETTIDPITLSLIEQAIPPNLDGRALFIHLLYFATVSPQTTMQYSLFRETGETRDEAIALITKVEDLARSPGSRWAPETYHKVLLVFEALGIIRRQCRRNHAERRYYTEIHIPLGRPTIHIPSLLDNLKQLHDDYSNRKIRQFAKKVAKRLKGEFVAKMAAVSAGMSPEQTAVFHIMVQVLREHGVAAIKQQVLNQAYVRLTGRVHVDQGEFQDSGIKRLRSVDAQQGDSIPLVGEFVLAQLGKENGQQGELLVMNSPEFACSARKKRSRSVKSGELNAIFTMNSPESTDSGLIDDKKGEFMPDVSIIGLSPEKNITITRDTIIDAGSSAKQSVSSSETIPSDPPSLEELRREAKFYEAFFDHPRSRQWTGSLMNVLKETTKDARLQAAVGAIFYSYFPQPDGRKVYSPGGWFTSACRRYSKPGAMVPAEIRAWAETNLPLKEIRRLVKEGRRVPSQETLPWEDEQKTVELNSTVELSEQQEQGVLLTEEVEVAEQNTEPVPVVPMETSYPLPVATTDSYMATWMDLAQAQRLRDRVVREGAMYRLGAAVQPKQRARCTVLVTWPGKPGEIEIINEEDWAVYFTNVKRCLDELE